MESRVGAVRGVTVVIPQRLVLGEEDGCSRWSVSCELIRQKVTLAVQVLALFGTTRQMSSLSRVKGDDANG